MSMVNKFRNITVWHLPALTWGQPGLWWRLAAWSLQVSQEYAVTVGGDIEQAAVQRSGEGD
jgi:hypothetical protein